MTLQWINKYLAMLFVLLASSHALQAGLVFHEDPNVVGFVANSASGSASFLAAIGTSDEFISFSVDKFGNSITLSTFDSGDSDSFLETTGVIYSDNVVFSSKTSATYGGINSANVNHNNKDNTSSEIGPDGDWNGILNIDFLAAGNTVNIVGFGPVQLGIIEAIRTYDDTNTLISTRGGVSNNIFDFLGIEATGGTRIGRVELEGDYFAIQDIQFNLIPEPTTLTLAAPGLCLVTIRRRRKQTR